MRFYVCLMLCCLTGACAFKESPKPSLPIEKSGPIQLEVSWGDGSSKVSRRLRKVSDAIYAAEAPMTIPADVPESIAVAVEFPEGSLSGAMDASSVGGADPKTLPVRKLETAEITTSRTKVGNWRLNSVLRGVKGSFPETDQEVRIQIATRITSEAGAYTIEYTLTTPPSKIETSQLSVEQYLKAERQLPEEVTPLRALSTRWDLLQVLSVKNNSQDPVQLTFPAILSGKVTTHFHRQEVVQEDCSFQMKRTDWDDTLGKELYLLPLSAGLNRRFVSVSNEVLSNNQVRLHLQTNEEVLLGIYGNGNRIADLIDIGHQPSVPQPVAAHSGCTSRCMQNTGYIANCFLGNGDRNDYERWCLDCHKYQVEYVWHRSAPFDPRREENCNRCRRMDEQPPAGSPDRKVRACIGTWIITYEDSTTLAGVQSYPVVLELGDAENRARASFAFGAEDKGASRMVKVFSDRSVQVE